MHRMNRVAKVLLTAAVMLAAALAACSCRRPGPSTSRSERQLVIRPDPKGNWEADLRDVEKVLYSAAGELWTLFPDRRLAPILVQPKGGPIVLFERGPAGEYRVRLDTGRLYWAQYAFQFAHEFCHILCGYVDEDTSNKWFEESLCETASLFVLRRMAKTWKTAPPYPHWKDFAPHLEEYARDRLDEVHLPAGTTLAEWYRRHADQLRKAPCQRDLNRVVASALLPLLEKHPDHWEAATWLNAGASKEPRPFERYLADWRAHCPDKHKPFVSRIAKQFGVSLPAD